MPESPARRVVPGGAQSSSPASNLSLALGRDMRQASKGKPLNPCREAPRRADANGQPAVACGVGQPAIRVAPKEGSHPPKGAPPVSDPLSRPVATSPDMPRPAAVAATPQAACVPLLGSALPRVRSPCAD